MLIGQILLNIAEHLIAKALIAEHFLKVTRLSLMIGGETELVLMLLVEHLLRNGVPLFSLAIGTLLPLNHRTRVQFFR